MVVLIVWLTWYVYASNILSWQTLTADLFIEKTVPTWAVMSFYLSSCPIWWSIADWTNWNPDLRWAFVRWINWDANWRDIVRALWDYQLDEFKSHNHELYWFEWSTNDYFWGSTNAYWIWTSWIKYANYMTSKWWIETRPKNIALLYCIKD